MASHGNFFLNQSELNFKSCNGAYGGLQFGMTPCRHVSHGQNAFEGVWVSNCRALRALVNQSVDRIGRRVDALS